MRYILTTLLFLIAIPGCEKEPPSDAVDPEIKPSEATSAPIPSAPVPRGDKLRRDCVGACLLNCKPFADQLDACRDAHYAGCFEEVLPDGFDCSPFLADEDQTSD